MKNYYYILGVKENASRQEIKNAYKKLSKKFHPDLNPNDKYFEDRFKEINEAYEHLMNQRRPSNENLKQTKISTEVKGETKSALNIRLLISITAIIFIVPTIIQVFNQNHDYYVEPTLIAIAISCITILSIYFILVKSKYKKSVKFIVLISSGLVVLNYFLSNSCSDYCDYIYSIFSIYWVCMFYLTYKEKILIVHNNLKDQE
jgi:hypothetical protein